MLEGVSSTKGYGFYGYGVCANFFGVAYACEFDIEVAG